MEDTVDEVIISAATTVDRLEQLVQERCWESDNSRLWGC